MNLLAIDSATTSCSVALMKKGVIAAEFGADPGQTHTRHLMRLVDAVFRAAGLVPADMDAWAVTTGPGSFTGLRIAMATVKGFALAFDRPICPVSCLAALARPYLGASGNFCAMLDARRKQVYAQVFRLGNGRLEEVTPAWAAPPEQVLDSVQDMDGPCWFAGSGAVLYREHIIARLSNRARLVPGVHNRIRAAVVAEMGREMICSGRARSAYDLVPDYIRNSDAEPNTRFY